MSETTLVVQQVKEWGEILTGFETRNKYVVRDTSGKDLYLAAEEEGNLILRLLLKAMRPFTIRVMTTDGELFLKLKRPFRFYFHEIDIMDSQGQHLGTIKKRFSLVRRIYSVMDPDDREIYRLYGPILKPWTFEIRDNTTTLGKIRKKWSGIGKEMFTDADNFSVTFPSELDAEAMTLFLGAVFLIDFVHFENKD